MNKQEGMEEWIMEWNKEEWDEWKKKGRKERRCQGQLKLWSNEGKRKKEEGKKKVGNKFGKVKGEKKRSEEWRKKLGD